MERYVVIVAGGSGSRMETATPKQFLLLHNKPVIAHAIEKFLLFDPRVHIIVALPKAHLGLWEELSLNKISSVNPIAVAIGGSQRFLTVKNSLEHVPDSAIVAIHDAVRPLVSVKTIAESFALAERYGSAVPYILPNASVRLETEAGSIPLNRDKVKLIQTPQTFFAGRLKEAYAQDYQERFTDDATVWEAAENQLTLFEGHAENIKITFPIDLKLAEYLLSYERNS